MRKAKRATGPRRVTGNPALQPPRGEPAKRDLAQVRLLTASVGSLLRHVGTSHQIGLAALLRLAAEEIAQAHTTKDERLLCLEYSIEFLRRAFAEAVQGHPPSPPVSPPTRAWLPH